MGEKTGPKMFSKTLFGFFYCNGFYLL